MATSTTVVDEAVSCSNRRRHDEDELQYVVVFPRVMDRILSVHCWQRIPFRTSVLATEVPRVRVITDT